MSSSPVARLLETVTSQHAGQSVVFDADGTLWRGDVGEDFLRFGIHTGLFAASYERYRQLLSRSPAAAYAYCVEVMAGLSEVALNECCTTFFAERYQGRIFSFVRPMLARLSAAGCPLWVCSASPRWTVAPGALALGIPLEHVIGVHCPVIEGKLTGVVELPVPVAEGKVAWLTRSGLKPALAVGNGEFDLDMLAFAQHALVISPPDSQNQLVSQAQKRGWSILSA